MFSIGVLSSYIHFSKNFLLLCSIKHIESEQKTQDQGPW